MTKKTNTTLVIKNNLLNPFAIWLNMQQLVGKESRERTRFVALLGERIAEIGKQGNELQEKYAVKDKDGKPKKITTGEGKEKKEVIDFGKNKEKADQEWEEYMSEEFTIDVTEGNKSKVYTVADILLNTEKTFQGIEAAFYAEWCECFEALPNRRDV